MKTRLKIFGALLAGASVLHAQTLIEGDRAAARQRTGIGTTLQQSLEIDARTPSAMLAIPLEQTIDPDEYVVGANDVFNLLVLGVMNSPVQLPVSPEGFLIIPGAGEIQAAGRTLADVKQQVVSEVKRKYRISDPSFTLFSPRRVIVNIQGAVRNPGPYVATAAMRIDKAVALANIPPDAVPPDQIKPVIHSTRNIVLRRKGFPDSLVDLDRYLATHQSALNPFVREGDVIIVPFKNLDQSAISVYGAVNLPGQYEYREADSLAAMIHLAGGLTPAADTAFVELTRLSPDATSSNVTMVDLRGILKGAQPDIPLQNKDRIFIRQKFDRRMDFKVFLRGEVKFPGTYAITADSTRLSEVIRRAGGLTDLAYLPNAQVERRLVTPTGEYADLGREALQNFRMNDQLVTPEERAYYDLEATLRKGTVPVDFVALMERNDSTQDILLKDGDVIFFPGPPTTVYVYGQVVRPGYVPYQKGADAEYYVEQAGGYGKEAEKGEMRVIKGKTREWLDPSSTTVEPGDYIWVPKDIRYPTGYYLNLVSQAASFISVVLSMTVIVLQLSGN